MERSSTRTPSGDAGGVVVGWLTRLVVVLSLVGVVLFDALSVGTSRLAVEDAGAAAARAAAETFDDTGDVQQAYATAVRTATDANALNDVPADSFRVLPDGGVTLTLRREATTFVVHRIGWIADWAVVSADAEGHDLT